MTDEPDRPRFIERAEPARTSEEARQRRSTAMLSVGTMALLFGLLTLNSGNPIAWLIGLLGIGLLVGGLVIRR